MLLSVNTRDRSNGRARAGQATLTVGGPLDPEATLDPAQLASLGVTAISIEAPVFTTKGIPQAGWGDTRTVVRQVWADTLHLMVDGRDYTKVQGAVTELTTWPSLIEPFVYGPAVLRFPAVPSLQFRSDPADLPRRLKGLRKHARVTIVPALAGVKQDPIWRGEITKFGHADGTLVAHCGGHAVARFSQTQRQPILFHRRKDGGVYLFDLFRSHNLTLKPRLGAVTGMKLDNRGSGESNLEYGQSLLADLVKLDGTQYTIGRTADDRAYRMMVKDTTTVHYTVFAGTDGVNTDGLVRDAQEEPNTFYGSGQDRDGGLWFNGAYPGLVQGVTPDYPLASGNPFGPGTTDDDLDDPAEERLIGMIWKLVGIGLLSRKDSAGGYDEDVEDALKELQEKDDLPVTGIMNPATWDALYDKQVTGYSTRQARVMPLVQKRSSREFDYTKSGDLWRRNPHWVPGTRVVSRTLAHGTLSKARATKWSKGEMERLNGPNWVGTIELTGVDVFAGDHNHGDPDPQVVSRYRIQPGKNIKVVHWDGASTLFHIAANQPRDWRSTSLAVDTQARDLPTIGAIVQRNRDSRINRGRLWKQDHGTASRVRDGRIPTSEFGGILDTPIPVAANTWTTFFVVAGDEGTVQKLLLRIPGCEYAVAVFGEHVSAGWLTRNVPNPFGKDGDGHTNWMADRVQKRLYQDRVLLHAYGTDAEPAGYSPRLHTKTDGSGVTTAPVTGRYENLTGFPYHCFGQPILHFGVFSKQAGTIRPGRVLWFQHAEVQ